MLHFAWVLNGIPRNSVTQRNSKDTTNAREKGQHAMLFHQQGGYALPFLSVSLLPPSSFLPPVRTPASQGPTSPSSAPPRADKTAFLLPRHHTQYTNAAWWGNSPRHSVARPNRDLCFLDGDNEHRSVRTTGVAPRDQRTLRST